MPTEVVGAVALRKALSQYAPDLAKELTKELGSVLKPVVNQARSFVPLRSPMSGWNPRSFNEGSFPTYNALEIRRGIIYKTTHSKPNRAGFVNNIRIQNKSMVGAIYETAGRKNGQGQDWVGPKAGGASKGVSRSVNPYAGNQFISNLGQLYGTNRRGTDHRMMGRLIFRAWAENKGVAEGIVNKAITTAEQELRRRSNTTSLRKAA